MAVLQKDIAKKLNMSTATVSRCLKHDPRISATTRARVFSCAARMGYRSEKLGDITDLQLVGGTIAGHFNIAAIVQAQAVPDDTAPIGHAILTGMSTAAQRFGASLILHVVPVDKRDVIHLKENQPRAMQLSRVDAAILVYRFGEESVLQLSKQLPCTSVAHYHSGGNVDYVGPDNIGGIRAIVDYLVKKGHGRIGYISHLYKSSFFDERWSGYILGMLGNGLEYKPKHVMKYQEKRLADKFDIIKKWIDDGVTAFVCANDAVAREVCRHLIECGYKIPGDVAVTGFDNDKLSTDIPELTTVEVNFEELGNLAVELMLARLTNPARAYIRVIAECKVKEGKTA